MLRDRALSLSQVVFHSIHLPILRFVLHRVRIRKEEIEQVFLLARVLYKAVLGLHYKRQEQKKTGQLAIF